MENKKPRLVLNETGFERTVNIIMQNRSYLLQFYQEILLC
jgi:hypothetical protein